jgi:uncharacterized protein with HEPN domain
MKKFRLLLVDGPMLELEQDIVPWTYVVQVRKWFIFWFTIKQYTDFDKQFVHDLAQETIDNLTEEL